MFGCANTEVGDGKDARVAKSATTLTPTKYLWYGILLFKITPP
jgi:hypothetical protein